MELDWRSLNSADADADGVVLLAVRAGDERRVFPVVRDYHTPTDRWRWLIVSSIGGMDELHAGWEPYAWSALPSAPIG